jgi:hypothetical protein
MSMVTPVAIEPSLYDELFDQAERARWRITDIPWKEIDRDKASDGLILVVRAALRQELPTYRATQWFMEKFPDNVDFSQWVSIWFYEETKHPQALRRWLFELGEDVDHNELIGGRQMYRFPRSFVGAMVVSIIAEMTAAKLYLQLESVSPEPVLRLIARNLAADEARHASGFYRFTVEALKDPEQQRRGIRDMLMVLQLWLRSPGLIQHPVNYFSPLIRIDDLRTETVDLESRVCQVIGNLVGLEIDSPQDVAAAIQQAKAGKARPPG